MMIITHVYLMQLIHILCVLEVELKDVEDTSVQIQNSSRDSSRGKYFTYHTISILIFDGNDKLGI